MTKDEIIEMARQLGICELTSKPKQDIHYSLTIHEMESFAKLVAQHEREECAKLCDEHCGWTPRMIGETIRARSNA